MERAGGRDVPRPAVVQPCRIRDSSHGERRVGNPGLVALDNPAGRAVFAALRRSERRVLAIVVLSNAAKRCESPAGQLSSARGTPYPATFIRPETDEAITAVQTVERGKVDPLRAAVVVRGRVNAAVKQVARNSNASGLSDDAATERSRPRLSWIRSRQRTYVPDKVSRQLRFTWDRVHLGDRPHILCI